MRGECEILDSMREFDETAAMITTIKKILLFCCAFVLVPQSLIRGQELQLKNLTGARGGNLVVPIPSDPSNFNRMMTSGLSNATVTDRLSAGLVQINRSSLQLEPALATQWEADKTGRTYTIHLRQGVRFSDGNPFTADEIQILSSWDVHH